MPLERINVLTFDFLINNDASKAIIDVCIEMLQYANELSDANMQYKWSVHTDVKTLKSQSSTRDKRTLMLCGDIENRWAVENTQSSKFRYELQQSRRVILVASAIFIPRQLKLFQDNLFSVHPNFIAAAMEEGILINNNSHPFSSSGKIKSAISGIAVLNLIIDIVSEDLGVNTGDMLSEYLGLKRPERDYLSQNMWKYIKKSRGDELISSALNEMSEHIESPLRMYEIAKKVGVSSRQMERRFKEKVNDTPFSIYRNLRLERANQLIRHTNMPITEVIVACGFSNRVTFTHWYKRKFKACATETRNQAYGHFN